jgi:ABC-type transport system substrate-binding protein
LSSLVLLSLLSCSGEPAQAPRPAGTDASSPQALGDSPGEIAGAKVLRLPVRTSGPGSLDPVRGSTTYDNMAVSLVYDTLLQYAYLVRPLELEPCLLAKMPEVSEDGLTYTFELRDDVSFHDDPCFPGGKGRKLVTADVFYSWKRMADEDNAPKSWWLFADTIAGFDEYRAQQNAAATFDYGAPVEGLQEIDERRFRVVLREPVVRFLYVLAMFQTAVVPREAVEKYGTRFSRHPVGTGPFTMDEDDWVTSKSMVFHRNPDYRAELYPSRWTPEDEALGLHHAAGERLPFADRIELSMFLQDQPMWLEFEDEKLDYVQIPAENYEQSVHKRRGTLKKEYAERGIRYVPLPLLDFIFRGFNMEDELVGGYTEEKRLLRAAISLAIDLEELNQTFYNGVNVVYDGMIPPGLDGHPANGVGANPYRGPDLERAKELLAKAGYPNGEGLPVIDYYTSLGGNSQEQTELLQRQLGKIGVRINPRLLEFAQLIEAVNTKKAPLFSFAWSSDYPDGENNLALFYGPNESPGSNHFNYENAAYDAMYEKIRTMPPSAERTALYEKMRDMVLADVPYVGSMGRTRHYLIHPWMKNFKPTEDFWNWPKYVDVAR